jgi:hypothetical protein
MTPAPLLSANMQRALEILRAKQCWCGRAKYPNHPFCGACYKKLDPKLRDAVGQRGAGFTDNYDAAKQQLETVMRRVVVRRRAPENFEYPD